MAAPKLLDKKTVNAEVVTQQRQRIQEGLALAKKVDVLRETRAEESQRLEQFRLESVAQVQKDIDAKIAERNALQSQIDARTEELTELRKPLDAEWERLKKQQIAVDQALVTAYQKKGELERGIAVNVQRERENEEDRQRIQEEKRRATAFLSQASELKKNAQHEFESKRAEGERIVAQAKEREQAVLIREQEVALRENENEIERKLLATRAKEQQKKDKEIADKYATLMRTTKRLHG